MLVTLLLQVPSSDKLTSSSRRQSTQADFNSIAISESDFAASEKEQRQGLDHTIHTRGILKNHGHYKPSDDFFVFKHASIWGVGR